MLEIRFRSNLGNVMYLYVMSVMDCLEKKPFPSMSKIYRLLYQRKTFKEFWWFRKYIDKGKTWNDFLPSLIFAFYIPLFGNLWFKPRFDSLLYILNSKRPII